MNFDRDTQRRLSELRRGRPTGTAATATAAGETPAVPETATATAAGWKPALPRHTARADVTCVGEACELHGPLEELLPGVAQSVAEGELYELRMPVATLGAWAAGAVANWERAMAEGRFPGTLHAGGNVAPEQIVFFDTETTALSNAPLFLVGALVRDAEGLHVRQLLARGYSEEPAVLAEARRLLCDCALAVSYNGNGFDLPYLRDRLRYHRLGALRLAAHLDLLPVARRKLGRSLGNCKLQTLELHLCRRRRDHDIPGEQIPQAYHDFVADGDAGRLRRIIEHNVYDIITLAELAGHLSEAPDA
jgi:uncharacterized protein YprB with RNaseH-like and TPR domain